MGNWGYNPIMGVKTPFVTGETWWNKSFDGNHWGRKIETSIHNVRISGFGILKIIFHNKKTRNHDTPLWQMETNTHLCRWSYLKLSPSNWKSLRIQMPNNEFCPNWTFFWSFRNLLDWNGDVSIKVRPGKKTWNSLKSKLRSNVSWKQRGKEIVLQSIELLEPKTCSWQKMSFLNFWCLSLGSSKHWLHEFQPFPPKFITQDAPEKWDRIPKGSLLESLPTIILWLTSWDSLEV